MNEVPVRALNQDTSGVLARVEAGEHLAVTERGRVIAHLSPVAPPELAELIAAGRVHPPTLAGPVPRPSGPVSSDDAGALLAAAREDERS
ncbi:type II toxin-antitoxin system Phd/YefM family antitoxin [Actinomycetospora soli]|uniref:type II toxin-antitoxin system Phd/YefM family antitoxin n=1 Tax=Actinomycetospora soli TaxID=2893887 RepID=UPI001E5FB7B2|nr:prevent-host-death family protein [Actinomycetospora soli]MCD2191091.1 prevent-host-death family protein [Actinomycetospora soli]